MNIIAIILTASMLMVSPTANLSSLTFNNSAIVYGHNYLDGGEFYRLDMSDKVAVYFADGSAKVYTVTDVQAYAAQSTELANTGEDFPLRVGDKWMTVTQVIDSLSFDGSIVLITCYPAKGITTGRLFVQLTEVR